MSQKGHNSTSTIGLALLDIPGPLFIDVLSSRWDVYLTTMRLPVWTLRGQLTDYVDMDVRVE